MIVRRALQTGSFDIVYSKDGQTGYAVEFTGFYVSAAVAPFFVLDEQPQQ